MVPPEAFLMSSAQAISDGFSGCWAGTQLDSFRLTGLSCARAAARTSKAANASTAGRESVRFMVVSGSLGWSSGRIGFGARAGASAGRRSIVAGRCFALVIYPAFPAAAGASCGRIVCGVRAFHGIAGAPTGALAHAVHRLLPDRPRRRPMVHQHLVERRAGVVGERGTPRRADGGRARGGGLEMRGARKVLDHVQQVVLAALAGRAIALDQAARLGQLAAERGVLPRAVLDCREPAFDQR